jgi:ABC-type bacteriocin/lantibiotic exporter with double-glycine peptidase domain
MSLMLIIPGILIPGFSKIFIDDILIKKTEDGLIILLLAMLVTSGVRALCTWLLQKHLIRLEAKLLLQSTAELLWHILRLPMSFFSQRYTGDIMDRISSNQQVAQLLSGGVTSSFVNIISMVFYGLVMLLMNWKLTLIAFLGVFLNASLLYFISIKISSKTFRLYQEIGKLKAMELNGLQIIETLKASSAEGVFFKRWAGLHARTINSQQSLASYALVLQVIPVLLQLLTSTIFFLGLGSYFVIKGQLTLGGLIAMQSLLASFNAPIDGLMSMGLGLQRLKGLFLRMEDVLAYPIEQRFLKPVTQHKNAKISGDLVVEDISFGYSKKDAPIVSGISFHLKQGESMAIVGSTGSGKSTITKCVADLYQPWSGSIRYANKAMKSLSRDELISSIALVDNDSYLFSGTLRENLTLWNADISNSALRQALQVACIEDEIVARGGLDTLVLEKGVNFSGGQRQRIELARALASKPSLLILDEALSALDPITEAKIMKNLAEIELTVLIITHRLTSIRHCNTIVVIKDGHKVQEGHHDQLIEEEGFYQLLCRDI